MKMEYSKTNWWILVGGKSKSYPSPYPYFPIFARLLA
jgi:hypothetical protein